MSHLEVAPLCTKQIMKYLFKEKIQLKIYNNGKVVLYNHKIYVINYL